MITAMGSYDLAVRRQRPARSTFGCRWVDLGPIRVKGNRAPETTCGSGAPIKHCKMLGGRSWLRDRHPVAAVRVCQLITAYFPLTPKMLLK
jgi:hypothetical protein